MTPEDIKAARAVIEAATPGPWYVNESETCEVIRDGDTIADCCGTYAADKLNRDARFIAAARAGWPQALDAYEARGKLMEICSHKCDKLQADVLNATADVARLEKQNAKLRAVAEAAEEVVTNSYCQDVRSAQHFWDTLKSWRGEK